MEKLIVFKNKNGKEIKVPQFFLTMFNLIKNVLDTLTKEEQTQLLTFCAEILVEDPDSLTAIFKALGKFNSTYKPW